MTVRTAAVLVLAAAAASNVYGLPSQSVDWMVGSHAHATDYQTKITSSTSPSSGPKGSKTVTIGTQASLGFHLWVFSGSILIGAWSYMPRAAPSTVYGVLEL